MRYALFPNQAEAEQYVSSVQAACDAAHVAGTPRIIICPFEALGQWAVTMLVEPAELQGEIVETVEPPIAELSFEKI